jgi:hypothetical protein
MQRWLNLSLVLALIAVVVWLAALPPNTVDRRFGMIKDGMTRADVEAIMGRAGEDFESPDSPANCTYVSWSEEGRPLPFVVGFRDGSVFTKVAPGREK